jgi:hypothetical protein
MLVFDGVSDELDNNPTMDLGSGDLTIMAWVRILAFNATTFASSANTNGGTVFSTRHVGTNRSPTLCYSLVSGTRRVIFCHDTDAVAVGAAGATALSLSTVYHFAGTFLSTNSGTFKGSWDCYLNGIKDNAATNNFALAGTAILPHTGSNWDIAHNNPWPDSESNNEIWDLRVYQRLLSANEIQTIYTARGHDGIVDGLVGRWLHNERTDGLAAIAGSVRDTSPSQWATATVTSDPLYAGSPHSKRRKHI